MKEDGHDGSGIGLFNLSEEREAGVDGAAEVGGVVDDAVVEAVREVFC